MTYINNKELCTITIKNTKNTRYCISFFCITDYNPWGLSTPTEMSTNSKRAPTLIARPSLQISTPTEKRNPTLKYKTQLVDRKQSVKLYQQSIPTQVHHLCTTQPVTSISSSKSDLLTKINHQDNSQQYHQDNQQDTSRNTPYSP
jgi:hypothetical protein